MSIKSFIKTLHEGGSLDEAQSEELFDAVFAGLVSEIELAGALVALRMRRETASELLGAVRSMRKCARPVLLEGNGYFDTCGTGGDNSHSFNISTATAIVLSAMNRPVVKHGNRSMSSRSGSADFLEALGVPVSLSDEEAARCFARTGFVFLYAPEYHPAMRYAAPVRKALGVRTIFNYCGPLANPASPSRQMIGVFHPDALQLYSEVVARLPYERVVVYSARSGMDEVSPFEPTFVYEISGSRSGMFSIDPREYLSPSEAKDLPHGLSAADYALLFEETVENDEPTALGKLIALNTALALYTLDGGDMHEHFTQALECVHDGRTQAQLERLREALL